MDEKIRIRIPRSMVLNDNGDNIMIRFPYHTIYAGYTCKIGRNSCRYLPGNLIEVLAFSDWSFRLDLNVKKKKSWKCISTKRLPAALFAREIQRSQENPNEDYIEHFLKEELDGIQD